MVEKKVTSATVIPKTGKRPVVPIRDLHRSDVDYILLEEATRAVEKFAKSKFVRNPLRFQGFQPYFALYNPKQRVQRNAAWKRGIFLKFLPAPFTKRKKNSIFYNNKQDSLFFSIEWVFPQAENFTCFEKRVIDTEKLAKLGNSYLDEENEKCTPEIKEKLQYYQSAGLNGVVFLLKAEGVPGEKFYELDHEVSLRKNLKKKVIIEYPTIYVVLKDHKFSYEIIEPEDNAKNPEASDKMNDSSEIVCIDNEQVKTETNETDLAEHNSDCREHNPNSRYLFMCGEIDSDLGSENEDMEVEREYYTYEDNYHEHQSCENGNNSFQMSN